MTPHSFADFRTVFNVTRTLLTVFGLRPFKSALSFAVLLDVPRPEPRDRGDEFLHRPVGFLLWWPAEPGNVCCAIIRVTLRVSLPGERGLLALFEEVPVRQHQLEVVLPPVRLTLALRAAASLRAALHVRDRFHERSHVNSHHRLPSGDGPRPSARKRSTSARRR